MVRVVYLLKGQRHGDIAVLGQFSAEFITSATYYSDVAWEAPPPPPNNFDRYVEFGKTKKQG